MQFFHLSDIVGLDVRGKDRTTFLNNLCTQNLKNLKFGECRELFLTDVKGKVQAHGFVTALDESLLLSLINPDAERICSHLDRYIIREDVEIANLGSNLAWYLMDGALQDTQPNSESSAGGTSARYGKEMIGSERDCIDAHSWMLPGFGGECRVIAVEISREAKFHECLAERGWEQGSPEDFELNRIQLGFPWFGIDFDETNLPQEIDRDARTIAFDKGCYLGQETVARLDALGQIQKKLCRVRIRPMTLGDLASQRKEVVLEDKTIGELRSTAWNRLEQVFEGFAWLRRGYFEGGTILREVDRVIEVVPLS